MKLCNNIFKEYSQKTAFRMQDFQLTSLQVLALVHSLKI